MPEKKFGMINILKGVFKIKKPVCEDIVHQADRIIADYVAQKRGEILSKYKNKKHWLRNLFLVLGFFLGLFFIYILVK
ncbi:MAG: hypothetical protein IJB70_09685 [Clostridia bacterium]|nr:hypothetical protein [Clostridia bacterium]